MFRSCADAEVLSASAWGVGVEVGLKLTSMRASMSASSHTETPLPQQTLVGVGTNKGLFLFKSNGNGQWSAGDPILPEWEVNSLLLDSADPDHLIVGTVHYAWGPTLRESRDGGKTWEQTTLRPKDAEAKYPINRIWQLIHGQTNGTMFAGVDEAALFKSTDHGKTWVEVEGLTNHESRPHWNPGAGGLCLHSILIDPADANRMWIAISAVGVFSTTDGGATWHAKNVGLPPMVQTGSPDENAMFCIHKIATDPTTSNRLFMQFHAHAMTPDGSGSSGVFRSDDAGDNWKPIDADLPAKFGFALAVTPGGQILVIPLESDGNRVFADGKTRVYRSDNAGDSWKELASELPSDPVYAGVLRDAMCIDGTPGGVYFGTTNGDVFATANAGDSWQRMPGQLPRVRVVRAGVYGG